jgi:hypothetical protein
MKNLFTAILLIFTIPMFALTAEYYIPNTVDYAIKIGHFDQIATLESSMEGAFNSLIEAFPDIEKTRSVHIFGQLPIILIKGDLLLNLSELGTNTLSQITNDFIQNLFEVPTGIITDLFDEDNITTLIQLSFESLSNENLTTEQLVIEGRDITHLQVRDYTLNNSFFADIYCLKLDEGYSLTTNNYELIKTCLKAFEIEDLRLQQKTDDKEEEDCFLTFTNKLSLLSLPVLRSVGITHGKPGFEVLRISLKDEDIIIDLQTDMTYVNDYFKTNIDSFKTDMEMFEIMPDYESVDAFMSLPQNPTLEMLFWLLGDYFLEQEMRVPFHALNNYVSNISPFGPDIIRSNSCFIKGRLFYLMGGQDYFLMKADNPKASLDAYIKDQDFFESKTEGNITYSMYNAAPCFAVDERYHYMESDIGTEFWEALCKKELQFVQNMAYKKVKAYTQPLPEYLWLRISFFDFFNLNVQFDETGGVFTTATINKQLKQKLDQLVSTEFEVAGILNKIAGYDSNPITILKKVVFDNYSENTLPEGDRILNDVSVAFNYSSVDDFPFEIIKGISNGKAYYDLRYTAELPELFPQSYLHEALKIRLYNRKNNELLMDNGVTIVRVYYHQD